MRFKVDVFMVNDSTVCTMQPNRTHNGNKYERERYTERTHSEHLHLCIDRYAMIQTAFTFDCYCMLHTLTGIVDERTTFARSQMFNFTFL